MVFFQVADHENEKGRDDKKYDCNCAGYLFQYPYTGFTENGDGFGNIWFDESEMVGEYCSECYLTDVEDEDHVNDHDS